jgi:hypothetical protein
MAGETPANPATLVVVLQIVDAWLRNRSVPTAFIDYVINKLTRLTFVRIAGLAAGAAAVSGAAVLVTASAAGYNLPFLTASSQGAGAPVSLDQAAAAPSALCTDFIGHLSADLNTSSSALNAAYQKAIGETLADEVKSGKLTQARADAIKKRLAGRPPCAIVGQLSGKGVTLGAFRPALLSAAASTLGITDATLKADLAKGMTLSQIAAAQKVTEAQFRAGLIAKLTPVLDAAVTNKKLTPAREQTIIKRLQTGPIPLWSRPIPKKAAATPTPASSTT